MRRALPPSSGLRTSAVDAAAGARGPCAMTTNLLADLPVAGPDETLETLVAAGAVRIERIVSTGQASPEGFWYDQDWNEWVMVLAGSAGLQIEGEDQPRRLKAGDAVTLPAHCRHRVAWTDPGQPTVWLAVHYP